MPKQILDWLDPDDETKVADVTAVAPLPSVGQDIPAGIGATPWGIPEAATLGQAPGFMRIKAPEAPYWELSPGEQLKTRLALKYGSPEQWAEAGATIGGQPIKAPHQPFGNIQGVWRGLMGGLLGADQGPTPGASPTIETGAAFLGEAAKYIGLTKALAGAGAVSDIGVGTLSGTIRELSKAAAGEDFSVGDVATEAITVGALGGIARAVGAGLKAGQAATAKAEALKKAGMRIMQPAKPVEPTTVVDKVGAPLSTPTTKAISVGFFGYTPEVAQSLSKSWNGIVDKVARTALNKIPPMVRQWAHNFMYGGAPEEVKMLMRQTEKAKHLGRVEAQELGAAIRAVPKEYHFDIYKHLDPQALGETGRFPKQYEPIVLRAQNRIEELGRGAVELGLLDMETFEANVGQYLRRLYPQYSKGNLFTRPFKRMSIKGDWMKRRKLKTPEARQEAGLITDPAYVVSRTVSDLTFDLETAKAFRNIARNPEWAQPPNAFTDVGVADAVGFRQVPTDRRYGDLSGMWMRQDVADEVFALVRPKSSGKYGLSGRAIDAMGDAYDKLLGMWKLGKTAWSPATHGRNIFSNFILADVGAGLSPVRVDIYSKALREYIKKGAIYKEAEPTGLFGTDWFGAEIGQVLSPKKVSKMDTMFGVFSDSFTGKAIRFPGKVYQGEEHWFKMAVYMHQRSLGASVEQAAAHAQKYLFNYSELSPALKRLRRSPFGGPFLAFTAKALPIMVESAIRRPVRFWKYPLLLKALHEGSRVRLGIDDKEWNAINLSLPEWRRNGFNVLMPARGEGGKPRLLDLTYNLPWGQIAESPSLLKHVPVLRDIPLSGVIDPFVGSNPFLTTPIDVLWNRNRFLDKPIYEKGIEDKVAGQVLPASLGGEAMEKIAGHVTRQVAPGIALAAAPVKQAVTKGVTKWGEKLDLVSTILSKLVGVKIIDVDTKRGLEIKRSQLFDEADGLRSKLIGYAIRTQQGGMTAEEFAAEQERLAPLIADLEKRAKELQRAYKQTDITKKKTVPSKKPQIITDWQ